MSLSKATGMTRARIGSAIIQKLQRYGKINNFTQREIDMMTYTISE